MDIDTPVVVAILFMGITSHDSVDKELEQYRFFYLVLNFEQSRACRYSLRTMQTGEIGRADNEHCDPVQSSDGLAL